MNSSLWKNMSSNRCLMSLIQFAKTNTNVCAPESTQFLHSLTHTYSPISVSFVFFRWAKKNFFFSIFRLTHDTTCKGLLFHFSFLFVVVVAVDHTQKNENIRNESKSVRRFDAVCMTKESRNDRIEEKLNVQQWISQRKISKGSCTIAELKRLWNHTLRDFGIRMLDGFYNGNICSLVFRQKINDKGVTNQQSISSMPQSSAPWAFV